MLHLLKNERGYTMLIVIMLLFFVSITAISLLTMNVNSLKTSKNDEIDQSVYYIAEGGLNVKSDQILEFANDAKLLADGLVDSCNNGNTSDCLLAPDYNHIFLNTVLNKFDSNLLADFSGFSIPNSHVSFTIECQQDSLPIKACNDYKNNIVKDENLTVIIKAEGNINSKKRTVKQEIELVYSPTIIPGNAGNIGGNGNPGNPSDSNGSNGSNQPSIPPIPIIESPDDWWVLPIYQFGSTDVPDLKNNNWTINGFDLKENCNGNNKNPECQYNLKLASHDQQKLDILENNYNHYKNQCSKEQKTTLTNDTYTFENDSVLYVNKIPKKAQISIDNPNAQVDLVLCNIDNFEDLEKLTSTNTQNMNIYLVSDTSKTVKFQKLELESNIFYAPTYTIDKMNSNSNNICTNLFVYDAGKINGAGEKLTNACSGTTPSIIDPPPPEDNNGTGHTNPIILKPTKDHYDIIRTVEI